MLEEFSFNHNLQYWVRRNLGNFRAADLNDFLNTLNAVEAAYKILVLEGDGPICGVSVDDTAERILLHTT